MGIAPFGCEFPLAREFAGGRRGPPLHFHFKPSLAPDGRFAHPIRPPHALGPKKTISVPIVSGTP